jgi:hypothetical protein
MQTIYKLDHSGEIIWRLGGKSSDFTMGAGTRFAWQHDARRRPDGTLSVLDNGATPAVERRSRALILALDETAMAAELVAQYSHPGVLAGSQGNVQLLDNGNVFVGWGEVPRVTEFDHGGQIVFDALLGAKYQSYRAFRESWSGLPAQAPAMALRGSPGSATAYASWNGATDVGSWQLLAGAGEDRLAVVARARTAGFETAVRGTARGPWFAVQALDGAGGTLGQSSPVALAA